MKKANGNFVIEDSLFDYFKKYFEKQLSDIKNVNTDVLIDILEKARNLDYDIYKTQFLQIIHSIRQKNIKDLDSAFTEFKKVISKKRSSIRRLLSKASNNRAVGNFVKSAENLEEILEQGSKDPDVYLSLGEDYLKLGDYERAQQNFLKIIDISKYREIDNDKIIDSHNKLGFSYIKQAKDFYKAVGKPEFEGYWDNLHRAIIILRRTIKSFPGNVKAYYLLVSAYLYLADYYKKRKESIENNEFNLDEALRQKLIKEKSEKLRKAEKNASKIVTTILESEDSVVTKKPEDPYFKYWPDLDSRRFLFHLNPFLEVGITLKCYDLEDSDRAEFEDVVLDLLKDCSAYTHFRDNECLETPRSWLLEFSDKLVLVEEYIPEQNMFRYFKELNLKFLKGFISRQELRSSKLLELEWIVDITAQLQVWLTDLVKARSVDTNYYTNGFETRFLDQLARYGDNEISDEQRTRLKRIHKRDINNRILCDDFPYEQEMHLLSIDSNLKNFLRNKKKIDLEIMDKKVAVIDPISAIEFATAFLEEEDEYYLYYRWLFNIIQQELSKYSEDINSIERKIGVVPDIVKNLVSVKSEVIKRLDDILTEGYNIDKDDKKVYDDYRLRFDTLIKEYISYEDQQRFNNLVMLVSVDRHLAIAADKLRDVDRIQRDTEVFIEKYNSVKEYIKFVSDFTNECMFYKDNILKCWEGISIKAGEIILGLLHESNEVDAGDFFREIGSDSKEVIDAFFESVTIYRSFQEHRKDYKENLRNYGIKDEVKEFLLRQNDISSNYFYYKYHLSRARGCMEELGLFEFRNELQNAYGLWNLSTNSCIDVCDCIVGSDYQKRDKVIIEGDINAKKYSI